MISTVDTMPTKNPHGILVALLVSIAMVVLVANGLADAVSGFIHNLGAPAEFAASINSMVFYGVLLAVLVIVLRALASTKG